MHGTWVANSISYSDRALKKNIRNLEAPADVLQKLRPVSYQMKEDSAKTRFGFIADEISKELPQITRTLPAGVVHEDERQGLVYQDLLAFLTAMLQNLAKDITTITPALASIESRIAERKRWKRKKKRDRRARERESRSPSPSPPSPVVV